MSPVDKVEARSSVELSESCNCTQCCPRSCGCWPRKVKHHHPHHQHGGAIPPKADQQRHSDHLVDEASKIAQAQLDAQIKPRPILSSRGQWEIEIDGKKYSLTEIEDKK